MDAILFYHFSRKITGSTFNAFEYYITILEHNPDFKFILVNGTLSDIDFFCSIFENRYDLSDINYRDNMIFIDFHEIIKLNKEFKRVLVLDYTTAFKVKTILRCPMVIHICEKTEEEEYQMGTKLSPVVAYGEMPFAVKDKEYRMKLAFNRFKKIEKAEEAVYINSPFCESYDFVKELELPDKPVIFKSYTHLKNLFEQFDEYIYYHSNMWFDPHPRLFLECAFYGKKITYINKYGIKDGSYYRYADLMKNGLKDRTLDENDEIVRQFI